ncbi:hypothetical protein J5N97_012478 [Dioscorea zingiberensis]|uniref:RING-type E3 ubiquitin transferase n=1 Tax=Dioscorea zingiberensis TaxID=325984 RepID=A0A9D5CQ82_9LILI|nr:hypothetical protein J5N97_012478 [Dioscorea zingiberensis]
MHCDDYVIWKGGMDNAEVEENLFAAGDAKLHAEMCAKLSEFVSRVLGIFPVLEAARPRSKSGIQALCSVHVALDKSKNLLRHCSDCSKLYLAITGDSILVKFEKARCALVESLKRVEDIVPQSIGCQIMNIVLELEGTIFKLDETEKQVGDEIVVLLQKEKRLTSDSNDHNELEVFHKAALRLGVNSSRAALTERRALKKLIERSRAEEDKRKELIVEYLLHLMRKYSKLFRSEVADDTDSQGSGPCSPTVQGTPEDASNPACKGNQVFERHLSKLGSFNFKQSGLKSGNVPTPPEELRCPISLQLMYDPVIISSGQTYERACIEKWFDDGHSTCPKTQQQLPHLSLTPNYCVKGLIASWCEQNGVPAPDGPPESLDINYWRLAFSDHDASDSRSTVSVDSCNLKGVKVVPLEDSGVIDELRGDEMSTVEDNSVQDSQVDEFERYESLLAVLYNNKCRNKQCEAVEQLRFLLKDDEEVRIYMGANGFVEALVQFLRSSIDYADTKAQTVGAMALFNLAVNNNRNKEAMLSSGIIPLLEKMIENTETHEPATALYLNLSCLDEAKPIISSSPATPFLVQVIQSNSTQSITCKHDALYSLYNLSTHPANIPSLLNANIIIGLHSLLTETSSSCSWAEKSLAVLINLTSNTTAKKQIIKTPGLIGGIATVLDTGEPTEQEQAVTCLLNLCEGDDKCCHMVLQEGVIPALVAMSANGAPRGKEKSQELLKLFREQRQREPSPVRRQEHSVEPSHGTDDAGATYDPKPLSKSRSKRLGRALTSMWKTSASRTPR